MSKENDLIRRGDVERIISEGLNNKTYGYDAVCILAELSEIPAIEQPMSADCFSRLGKALLARLDIPLGLSEEEAAERIIKEWAQEHPERNEG